jgi:catechol 2,3-dioxygenase-like lactoylglutathione lyase family enzyme
VIHHIDVPVRDLSKSRAFFDAALAPLGLQLVMHNRHDQGHEVLGYGSLPDPVFWIRNGKSPIEKLHVAFAAPTREAVDDFHRAALNIGGMCNGPPGLRPWYADNYYAAFILDPDGNNIEAVCRT